MYRLKNCAFVAIAALFSCGDALAQQPSQDAIRDSVVVRMRLVTAAAGQFYAANARYADSEQTLGLPSFPNTPWISATILNAGSYEITLSAQAGGGTIRFLHQIQNNEFINYWTCQSVGRPDIASLLPGCRDALSITTLGNADHAWLSALRREMRDEIIPLSRAYQDNLLNYYLATNLWPSFITLPFLQIQPMRWVQSTAITAAPNRGFEIALNAEFGGGTVRYRLVEVTSGLQSNAYFECRSERADIAWILPGCSSDVADAGARGDHDPYWLYAKRGEIRDDLQFQRQTLAILYEFYLSRGRWPVSLTEASAPFFLPRRWLASEQYQPGQYAVLLNRQAGLGAVNYFIDEAQSANFADWRCQSDRLDIRLILPDCRTSGSDWQVPGPEDAELWMAYRGLVVHQSRQVSNYLSLIINEYFVSLGMLPSDAAAIGLLPDFEIDQFAVRRLQIASAGQFSMAFTVAGGGGNVSFAPIVQGGDIVRWDCRSSDRIDIASIFPGCVYQPALAQKS